MPQAYIAHLTTSRVRIKVPDRRGDVVYFSRLGQNLAASIGVVGVEINAATGSVLVHGSGGLEAVLQEERRNRLFELEAFAGPSAYAQELRHSFGSLNRRVAAGLGAGVDLATLALYVLLTIALWQLLRGNATVPAITALWYAAEIARNWLADVR